METRKGQIVKLGLFSLLALKGELVSKEPAPLSFLLSSLSPKIGHKWKFGLDINIYYILCTPKHFSYEVINSFYVSHPLNRITRGFIGRPVGLVMFAW